MPRVVRRGAHAAAEIERDGHGRVSRALSPQVLAVPSGGLVEGFDLWGCQGPVGPQVELHVVVGDGAPHGGEELSSTRAIPAAASGIVKAPAGREGRRKRAFNLAQAVAVIDASQELPELELPAGLKDPRRPAALMHAYIVVSLMAGVRTEEARAVWWDHVDLDGDPDADPPVPPHVNVWRADRVGGDTETPKWVTP
jgi:hypothetical protein